jgi:pyruvate dehydrogenase E2 component (dihydrolipoamide acetyltransferase)
MEEGTFVEWLKQDGDVIAPGDVLFTVESDKSLNEVEAFDAGILRIPPNSPAPGSRVPVGTVLGYIVAAGDDVELGRRTEDRRQRTEDRGQTPAIGEQPSVARPPSSVLRSTAISPRARRIAAELGVNWSGLTGSGKSGRIVERDVRAALQTTVDGRRRADDEGRKTAVNVSPLAQRLAQELGVDLIALAQQMPGKRIERADVEKAAARKTEDGRQRTANERAPAAAVTATSELGQSAPMSATRRVIAERMAASARTTAPVTLTTEADATELVKLRAQLKADGAGAVPSFNDLLIKIAAQALTEHPTLNARLDGDQIVQYAQAHVGLAVDTERGLLVVVVRDAQARSLRGITAETGRLVERARAGQSAPDELRGGTFTITNLGVYDIDFFTPIINLPECAILGVGRIAPKQVVIDAEAEKVAIRQMVALSLTFDHRLVDGAPAARFLQRVKQLVERPYLWLVG